jgi:DNA processing protein
MKINDAVSMVLGKGSTLSDVEKEVERCKKMGVDLIPFGDERYPRALSTIREPPLLLYVWGKRCDAIDKFSIAIVGSRMATSYGRSAAQKISEELSRVGTVIVSGLAHGIDSVAHSSAIKEGVTIGVLGTGIDIVYPESKRELFERVKENGCIVSEFSLGTRPTKWTFPKRNRIIAGLSMGVVVVEASQKSGSLITARLALEEGREVFAVPGSIFSETSEGTNYLIRQGAKCVSSGDDVLEEFGYIKKIEKKEIAKDPIIEILKSGPKTFEEISFLLHTSIEELNVKLTMLEVDGIISKDVSNKFKMNC